MKNNPLFSLYILPGTIFTWFFYMFPKDGSYKTMRQTARWYRSNTMKFFISTFFYYLIITSALDTGHINEYNNNSHNNNNTINKKVNIPSQISNNSSNTVKKIISSDDIENSSGAFLCLMLTDKYTLSDTETLLIINELKARNGMCDGSKYIYFN